MRVAWLEQNRVLLRSTGSAIAILGFQSRFINFSFSVFSLGLKQRLLKQRLKAKDRGTNPAQEHIIVP
jgi:hypothetical protein